MTKRTKTRQPGDSGAIALARSKIQAEAAKGKGVGEIAEELGMSRQRVSRALNSEETKALIKEAENELLDTIRDAVDTIREAITQRTDMGTASRTAIQLLKNFRLLKDAPVEIEGKHALFIIEKRDGTQVIMGAKGEGEDDGET